MAAQPLAAETPGASPILGAPPFHMFSNDQLKNYFLFVDIVKEMLHFVQFRHHWENTISYKSQICVFLLLLFFLILSLLTLLYSPGDARLWEIYIEILWVFICETLPSIPVVIYNVSPPTIIRLPYVYWVYSLILFLVWIFSTFKSI